MLASELVETKQHTISFDIVPVIHLRDGQTIDFTGGKPEESAIFDNWAPLETARFWINEGASWLHIVDIDAMFQRDSTLNWQLITKICALPVRVQLVGGHFHIDDIERAFQAGVSRIMLDASQPDINLLASSAVTTHGPEAIGVMFTTRAVGKVGAIAASDDWPDDWAAAGGEEAVTRALQLYRLGITTGVHTTIADDGAMSGCDARITQELASLSGINFQAGGEIYDLDDVVSCYNRKGVTGVLIGRALYNGSINLKQALRTTRRKLAFETGLPDWKRDQHTVKARLRYQIAQSYLQRHLPERSLHILDAGGGNGQEALALASNGHDVELLDESTAMIADFKESNELNPSATSITTHNCNIREIPRRFNDELFDLVMCHNVIQYVTDWEHHIRSSVKPLKSGGLFSLIVRNRQALPYQIDLESTEPDKLDEVAQSFVAQSNVFNSEITLFTPGFLIDWLSDNGFESVLHYGILSLNHYAETSGSPDNEMLISKLASFETALGKSSPYRDVARYTHLIAVKS